MTASVAAFGICLWLAGSASFGWLPRTETERWAIAAAFAAVVAGAVGAPLGWWAGRETRGGSVVQKATATGDSRTTQVGGSRGTAGGSLPPGGVEQQAESSGSARITQIGGDQHPTGP
ncbi:hypothetical protein [Streptomyces sp. NPDC020681]|uniref:hypothetical protein n=1 Tax=Streptomyces sp. NPDC020681 TaxID=3365083 RepID=UPI0037934726